MDLNAKKKELLKMKASLEELQKEIQLGKWKQEQQNKEAESAKQNIIDLGYDPDELSQEFFTKLLDEINSEHSSIEKELINLKKDIQENA